MTTITTSEQSRTEHCEDCGAPTSFERRNPLIEPPEGEICEQCQRWVCPDCVHSIGEPCPPERELSEREGSVRSVER